MTGPVLRRESQLVWVDRSGREAPVGAPSRRYFHPRLSRDASRVAVEVEGSQQGVWIFDVTRGALSRFTADDGFNAVWTPDGSRLTFEGSGARSHDIFSRSSDGTGDSERLVSTKNSRNVPTSWAPDGSALAFVTPEGDLWIYSVADRAARPFLNSQFNESGGVFSPDSHWIAYSSDETGRMEIYAVAYPGGGHKLQLSTDGGTEPAWAPDGRELYYRNGDKMMAVPIRIGSQVTAGKATLLFDRPYARRPGVNRADYDVAPDGRFLMIKTNDLDTQSAKLQFVTQWFTELRQRMPGGSSTGTLTRPD